MNPDRARGDGEEGLECDADDEGALDGFYVDLGF